MRDAKASAASGPNRPTFDEAYECLESRGPADIVSSRGTRYSVSAGLGRRGRRVVIARPRSGQVRIHDDCWGEDRTCQRTQAGGVYNGSPSIWDWLRRWQVGGERSDAVQ